MYTKILTDELLQLKLKVKLQLDSDDFVMELPVNDDSAFRVNIELAMKQRELSLHVWSSYYGNGKTITEYEIPAYIANNMPVFEEYLEKNKSNHRFITDKQFYELTQVFNNDLIVWQTALNMVVGRLKQRSSNAELQLFTHPNIEEFPVMPKNFSSIKKIIGSKEFKEYQQAVEQYKKMLYGIRKINDY